MGNLGEINEDEVFEKRESKMGLNLKKIMKNKKLLIGIVVLLVILVLVILEVTMGIFSGLLTQNEMGNSAGNIINCGYSVEKDGFIYYVSPSETMNATQISRVKSGSNEPEILFTGSYDIRALNIVGNKIYFISIAEEASYDDGVDNKIYKMDLDGSDLTVINDNEFAYDDYYMYLVKNKIYYVGTDYNVYEMDLNGKNRKLVADIKTGDFTLNDQWIFYNKANEEGTDYSAYIRPINGGEERQMSSTIMTTPVLYQDFVYYLNDEQHLAKMPIAGGQEEELTQNIVFNLNISNGFAYYLDYLSEEKAEDTIAIFQLNLESGESKMLKELSNYSSFLNVVGDFVYYMDMDDEKAFINLIHTKDLSEVRLYEWNYSEAH